MLNVDPVLSDNFLDDLYSVWSELYAKSPGPTFQFDPECVKAWTENLSQQWKTLVLKVSDNDRVIGLFPLMYRDEKRKGLLPYRRVRFLGSLNTDFNVVLAEAKDVEQVITAALDWLFSGSFRWELMILDDLPDDSPVPGIIQSRLDAISADYEKHEGKYYYVDLDRPWEEAWLEMSKKFVRRNTNLARNRITKAGQWEVAINPDLPTKRLIEQAAIMHKDRQSELERESFYSSPESARFVERIIDRNREMGRFCSYWLKLEGSPIAYMFGFEQDNVFYAWNMAFDPQHSNLFPSKLLMLEIIKDCHARGLKEFNFMRGETEYKSKWTKHHRINHRFKIKNKKSLYGKTISALESMVK